jgi:Transglycosylase SLT domain/D-alanyl-D-alanine carboxypeptidase
VNRHRFSSQSGQALLMLVGAMCAVLVGAFLLGAIAKGVGGRSRDQKAADLGALAGARAMLVAYPRLFEPQGSPRALSKGAYVGLARRAALDVAARNGADVVSVSFPDGRSFAPVRIAVEVRDPVVVDVGSGGPRVVPVKARAEAELAAGLGAGPVGFATGGGYNGPLAYRQGKPMRPDVALAFDRMYAAARADGVTLIVNSAYRSDAEQAALFAANPDPKWVAPPGQSLHRLGTELDLGPPGAMGWMRANGGRFGFLQRYSWESWHWGYTRSAGTTSVGFGGGAASTRDDGRSSAIPSFVPARFAPMLSRAAQRYNVGAALLAAQIYAESNFNPNAVSGTGAQGIAQFMPGTAGEYGLRNPFDPEQAIDAQARLMRDLLRRFASVPLALAAYNAGAGRVAACMCIPPIPETRGYVARILGLLGGAGDASGLIGLEVRLVK